MNRLFLFLSLISLWSIDALGQTKFEQPLDPERISPGINIISTSDNHYLYSSFVQTGNPFGGGNLNLTKLAPNGNVVWSKDFDYFETIVDGHVSDWPAQDAILLSTFLFEVGSNLQVTKLDQEGNIVWSRRYGSDNDVNSANLGRSIAKPVDNSSFILAGGSGTIANNIGANDPYLAQIDADGNLLWGRTFCFSCLGEYDIGLYEVINTSDGGFLLKGLLDKNVDFPFDEDNYTVTPNDFNGLNINNDKLDLGPDTSLCETPIITLDGTLNGNYEYSWNTGDTTAIIQVDQPGIYILEATDSDNCFTLVDSVVVSDGAPIDIYIAVDDSEFCTEGFFSLTAIGPTNLTYIWSTSDTSQTIVVNSTGLYAVSVSNDCGSTIIDTLLEAPSLQTGLELSGDGNFCTSGQFTLTADTFGVDALSWSTGETKTTIIVNAPGVYTATVSNQCGSFTDSIEVSITPDQFPNASFDVIDEGDFCISGSFTLVADLENVLSFEWSTGEITEVIEPTQPGLFSITAQNLCDTVVVKQTPFIPVILPEISVSQDSDLYCLGRPIELIAEVKNAQGVEWSTGSVGSSIFIQEFGQYSVSAENFCGTETVSIDVEEPFCFEPCGLFAPNIFTPNDDGVNDVFRPEGNCLSFISYEMRIYSRWGEMVFSTSSFEDTWDGTYKGKELPTDVFVYVIEYKETVGNTPILLEGEVMLLR